MATPCACLVLLLGCQGAGLRPSHLEMTGPRQRSASAAGRGFGRRHAAAAPCCRACAAMQLLVGAFAAMQLLADVCGKSASQRSRAERALCGSTGVDAPHSRLFPLPNKDGQWLGLRPLGPCTLAGSRGSLCHTVRGFTPSQGHTLRVQQCVR
eukprot:363051-Chlamydomonas_euryale.AAC.3